MRVTPLVTVIAMRGATITRHFGLAARVQPQGIGQSSTKERVHTMLLLIIVLILLFGGGGGYYGYGRWGTRGGAGIGLGGVLLILLVAYLLGGFRA